ncbi:General stress protein A [Shimia sp. SK013]|nr:General stress protein A [Shimia sp. SK013]
MCHFWGKSNYGRLCLKVQTVIFPKNAASPESSPMTAQRGPHQNCLAFVTDAQQAPLAQFAARQAAHVSGDRNFDILICSFEPLTLPDELTKLGIRNKVLNLRKPLTDLNLPLKWLPLEVYLRLWLPQALGDRYRRILYADTDTYLLSPSLDRLFDVDMGPHPVAGVRDVQQWLDLDAPINDFAERGLPGLRFLNSGVMLMDSSRVLETDLLDRLLVISKADTPTTHHDQSLLNLELRGEWAELHPAWNWQWTHIFPTFTRLANPQMLHFCGPKKPWRAHQKENRFSPALIREYQRYFARHGGDLAFHTWLPGGRRVSPMTNLRNWRWQRRHPEKLEALVGRFASPFSTLL